MATGHDSQRIREETLSWNVMCMHQQLASKFYAVFSPEILEGRAVYSW